MSEPAPTIRSVKLWRYDGDFPVRNFGSTDKLGMRICVDKCVGQPWDSAVYVGFALEFHPPDTPMDAEPVIDLCCLWCVEYDNFPIEPDAMKALAVGEAASAAWPFFVSHAQAIMSAAGWPSPLLIPPVIPVGVVKGLEDVYYEGHPDSHPDDDPLSDATPVIEA